MKYEKRSNEELAKKLAENVRMQRAKHNLSMEILAEKAEMSTYTICKIENCSNNPNLFTLAKLAKAFECKIEDLLY